jgi:hypothetical protein
MLAGKRTSAVVLAVLLLTRQALAGMPTPRLTDSVTMQLSTISFFLMALFASALVIKWLWNWLARDFERLPRVTYRVSLGLVTLWGILFVLVLTMIAGARELLTPGAWQQHGFLYKLDGAPNETEPAATTEDQQLAERQEQLRRIKERLWEHAARNEGRFPESIKDINDETLWQTPGAVRLLYRYNSGKTVDGQAEVLVYEPGISETRLALITDGSIIELEAAALYQRLDKEGQP